jgi:hypothetical protein
LEPQPRVLIASVPYALKAADSATLGGLPASAFVLAGTKASANLASAAVLNVSAASGFVTTSGGTAGYLPEFTGTATIADSPVFVSGGNVGIGSTNPIATLDVNGAALISGALTANGGATVGGPLELAPTATATSSAAASSQSLKIYTSAFNSSTKSLVTPRFQWQGEVLGNNTSNPSATLNLLSSTTANPPTETGFHFNANGTIQFAPGQTFPGTGNGTITGVTAGTGLTGGGTSGKVTLNVDTTKVVTSVTAGTGLIGGGTGGNLTLKVDPTQVPLLNSSNIFGQNLTVKGQIIAGIAFGTGGIVVPNSEKGVGSFAGNGFTVSPLGFTSFPLDMQSTTRDQAGTPISQDFQWEAEPATSPSGQPSGSMNLLYGANNGAPAETGFLVNANGQINAPSLLVSQPAGNQDSPELIVRGDDNGTLRGTPTQLQLQGASNPSKQLLLGYLDDGGSDLGYGAIQATVDNVRNTPLALNPNGGGVGIQTTSITNTLTVGQGQGAAIADGWATYSSRRFKTDIQTLSGALDKIERMRGVSYTLKATGKHEIGVIAEEVGAVVPEAVTYEANGKDARSVDYNRLTAVLIEAVKQQQAQLNAQEAKSKLQEAQISELRYQVKTMQTSLKANRRSGSEARTVKAHVSMLHE